MCDLCSNDPKEKERARLRALEFSELLTKLAYDYQRMGNGNFNPHGLSFDAFDSRVKRVIRRLVEEWV